MFQRGWHNWRAVTEVQRREKRSVWFPHSCRREQRGTHQLQTMALYPCQCLPNTHSLKKKTKKNTDAYLHECTRAHKLWSSCISTPFMDNKRRLESVCVCARVPSRSSSPRTQLSASLSPISGKLTFLRLYTCFLIRLQSNVLLFYCLWQVSP